MANTLRVGGWFVGQELDFGLFTLAGHPDAAKATTFFHDVWARLLQAGIVDVYLGRRLLALVTDQNLMEVGANARTSIAKLGDPEYETVRLGMHQMGPAVEKLGLSQADFQMTCRVIDAPSTRMVGVTSVGVWGKRTDEKRASPRNDRRS
jgi:hypothetical protein